MHRVRFHAGVALVACLLAACGGQDDTGGGITDPGGIPPTITTQPAPVSVQSGDSAIFFVAADGDKPLSYEWQRNQTPIAGATSPLYVLHNAQLADSGVYFRVKVSNAAGSVLSAEAPLAVTPIDDTPSPASSGPIVSATSHVLLISQDGTVLAWGDNEAGQLGNGGTEASATPAPVPGLSDIIAVSTSAFGSLALDDAGRVYAWGANVRGTLGNGSRDVTLMPHPSPAQVAGLPPIIAIAAGDKTNLALAADSTVWEFGMVPANNGDGLEYVLTPRQVPELAHIAEIAAGYSVLAALGSDGTVWTWGFPRLCGDCTDFGTSSALGPGIGTETARVTPLPVTLSDKLHHITMNGYGEHIVGLSSQGIAIGWGDNACSKASLPVTFLNQVSAGAGHNLGIRAGQALVAWGCNYGAQLGTGDTLSAGTFVEPGNLTDVIAIAAGLQVSVAIQSDGSVWTWGHNNLGQLGNGTAGGKVGLPAKLPGIIARH
jgi:alpha-tubulin suppressor-like RCC1 family protein